MRPAFIANQQRIALRVVSRTGRTFQNFHHSAIGILPVTGRDAFGNNRARVFLPMWIIFVPVSAC